MGTNSRYAPSLSVPPTQNTAPVLEHNCLFTHDVRKKQKKWQDGFLRYHTFNKRVMVYDIPRNFIGDTHWTSEVAIQDGDELHLDRTGVLVQVAELVGRTETDLTDLRKSAKRSSDLSSSPARMDSPRNATGPTSALGRRTAQMKHRSLQALLGTPKGAIGVACLPTKSPFEVRQQRSEREEWEGGRPLKRICKEQEQSNIVAEKACISPRSRHDAVPSNPRAKAGSLTKSKPSNKEDPKRLRDGGGIHGCDDAEGSASVSRGLTLDAVGRASRSGRFETSRSGSPAAPSSPDAFQVQQASIVSRAHAANRSRTPREAVHAVDDEDSASSSARPLPQDSSSRNGAEPVRGGPTNFALSNRAPAADDFRTGRLLRLSATAPRKKTLLCQDQLQAIPNGSLALPVADSYDPGQRTKTASQKLAERLARIDRKNGSTARSRFEVSAEPAAATTKPHKSTVDAITSLRAPEVIRIDDDVEMIVGQIDQSGEFGTNTAQHRERLVDQSRPDSVPQRSSGLVTDLRSLLDETDPQPKEPHPQNLGLKAAAMTTVERDRSPDKSTGSMPPPAVKRTNRTSSSGNSARPALQTRCPNSARGVSAFILGKAFKPPSKPTAPEPTDAIGPWSRDAFDLFVWRPPDWDEQNWCVKQQ